MSRDSIRGFAAGLLFSTIIMGSYYYFEEDKQQELTIEQLGEASAALGYERNNKNQHNKEAAIVNTYDTEVESISEPATYKIIIAYGMGSDDIARILIENNMIESSDDFEAFFKDNQLTKKIQIGEFQLTKDMTIEEIANIITKKQQ